MMFTTFFYLLKAYGLKVSLGEWMILMDALDKGLAASSFIRFYRLCRSILVCSEADFDKFDAAFLDYFSQIRTPEDLPKEFEKWLDENTVHRKVAENFYENYLQSLEDLRQIFEERKKEQDARHDRGSYWIGTGGTSTMGHDGDSPNGVRVRGQRHLSRALLVAAERNFHDFRQDTILTERQFQMAFRKLRHYSSRIGTEKTELDLAETITETSSNGGRLSLVFAKPRKNTIKIMVLFDSDGSMQLHSRLTKKLFSAVNQTSHFRDIQFFYYHNCIYEKLYKSPQCKRGDWVDTEYVLSNMDGEYRVIIVGDATMAPSELEKRGGNALIGLPNDIPGIDWLRRFRNRYEKLVWFNPIRMNQWENVYGSYTLLKIKEIFPMYELTLDGLEAGIKRLFVSR